MRPEVGVGKVVRSFSSSPSRDNRSKGLGGRAHLGKYCNGFDMAYLQKLHGEYFQTFQHVMVQHDPAAKFSNAFTERLFGPNANLADTSTTAAR